MRMRTGLMIAVCLALPGPADADTLTYLAYEEFGGTWHDAEKSEDNTEDDRMCWAAAAANVLDRAEWDAGFADHDAMFALFQDHWEDSAGFTYLGWQWWFEGFDHDRVDVPGGGGFYPTHDFYDYDSVTGEVFGLHITNSDDDKLGDAPRPDVLAYKQVYFSDDLWYLADMYMGDWWIGRVSGLDRNLEPVPEPSAIVLFGLAAVGLAWLTRAPTRR